jgi:dienelactone hydrolase
LDQAFDAHAALRYLSTLEVVGAKWVALFGQSMGSTATPYAIDRDLAAQYFDQRFRAAIAYYPTPTPVPSDDSAGADLDRRGGPMERGRRLQNVEKSCAAG